MSTTGPIEVGRTRRTSVDLVEELRARLENISLLIREHQELRERCDAIVDAITDDIAHVRAPVRHDRDRFKEALEIIRDNHWVENALDPQWPARVAKKVLEADDG